MSDKTPTVPEAPEVSEGQVASKDPQADLEASRREAEELLTKLKYLQAEFENYRKRVARDTESFVKFAHERLVSLLLPILDELDAAVEKTEGPAAGGLRMVRDNFVKTLGEVGVRPIPAQGLPFDPYVHECVERVADPASPDGVVKAVVQKGYRLHERVLRPAQVIVVNNGGEGNG